jgi:hypothetical protein
MFSITKEDVKNGWIKEVNCTEPSPSVRVPLLSYTIELFGRICQAKNHRALWFGIKLDAIYSHCFESFN